MRSHSEDHDQRTHQRRGEWPECSWLRCRTRTARSCDRKLMKLQPPHKACRHRSGPSAKTFPENCVRRARFPTHTCRASSCGRIGLRTPCGDNSPTNQLEVSHAASDSIRRLRICEKRLSNLNFNIFKKMTSPPADQSGN